MRPGNRIRFVRACVRACERAKLRGRVRQRFSPRWAGGTQDLLRQSSGTDLVSVENATIHRGFKRFDRICMLCAGVLRTWSDSTCYVQGF